jgi:hypothetical protein
MTLIEAAKKDLGKKEKPGNTGFEDKELEKAMKAVGWAPGWAWCASIQEKWIREAFPERAADLNGFFVPSAVATFRNLKNAKFPVSLKPTEGALVFWQRMKNGVPQWQGHAGIVSKVINEIEFYSIEGNTNEQGSREGTTVLEKHRVINWSLQDGLKVLGFIKIV